jgi:hypothetical protein
LGEGVGVFVTVGVGVSVGVGVGVSVGVGVGVGVSVGVGVGDGSVGTSSNNGVVSDEAAEIPVSSGSEPPLVNFTANMTVPAITTHIPAIRSAVMIFSLRFLFSDTFKTPQQQAELLTLSPTI